jgi:ribose transport system substrate-binding protein
MRRAGLGGLAILFGILVAVRGCGKSGPQAKYRIAVIPKGLTHEFWQSIHRGAQRAAADLADRGTSVEIIWDGPLRESDALAQIRIVDHRVSTEVDGIVLAPQHSKTMVRPVKRALAEGIPTVIIDSGLARQDIIVKYVATNNYHGGWLAAEHLLQVLRDEGKPAPNLILFRYAIGSESTEQREKGFMDYVHQVIAGQRRRGEPTVTILSDDKYAGATKETASKEATPLLNNLRDRGIDGIFAPNESSAGGMLDALRNLGLNRKIHLMGFDSNEPLLDAVRKGDIDGLILQDPYKMGYLGVWMLVQHLEGYDVAADNHAILAASGLSLGLIARDPCKLGFLGTETLLPRLQACDRPDDPMVLSTGEHLITRANVDALTTRELFRPELQERRRILHPVLVRKR